jgi:hypothetical protein
MTPLLFCSQRAIDIKWYQLIKNILIKINKNFKIIHGSSYEQIYTEIQ